MFSARQRKPAGAPSAVLSIVVFALWTPAPTVAQAPCCVSGTCSLETPEDCTTLGGNGVCACLGDTNPANGIDDACEACAPASAPLPLASDPTKNRYVSLDPNNVGSCTALRVQLVDQQRCDTNTEIICISDTDCPGAQTCINTPCVGTTWWVGTPVPVDDRGTTLFIAPLSDQPVYRDWTETEIHVGDFRIVPASTYEMRAIREACNENPGDLSSALVVPTTAKPSTKQWADVVGNFDGGAGEWMSPDGLTNLNDILAMLDGFQAASAAPSLVQLDLMRSQPDQLIDIRDIHAVVRAVTGLSYPGLSSCDPPPEDGTGAVVQGPVSFISCALVDSVSGVPLPLAPDSSTFPIYDIVPTQDVTVELFIDSATNGLSVYQTAIVVDRVNPSNGTPSGSCPALLPEAGTGSAELVCDQGEDDDDLLVDRTHENSDGDRDWVFDGISNSFDAKRCSDLIVGSVVPTSSPAIPQIPPGYLSSYRITVPLNTGGNEFAVRFREQDELFREVGYFIEGNQSADADTISVAFENPCALFRIGFDCNQNLVDDSDDIGSGTSADCNGNSIPDECEIRSDSTATPPPSNTLGEFFCSDSCVGCPVTCDMSACVVTCDPDCNDNGVPDACDIDQCGLGDPTCSDCNANCVPDSCDIANCADGDPLCDDCNSNAVPDECEIGDCAAEPYCNDCDQDDIPDECEILAEQDCDLDGICNACAIDDTDDGDDLQGRCSTLCIGRTGCNVDKDCQTPGVDGHGVPDSCDLGGCPSGFAFADDCRDCNGNAIPDWCDINIFCAGEPCCGDCNINRQPDACDIDADDPDGDGQTSPDCQPNAIPDECELVSGGGARPDVNGNNIPDECDVFRPELGLVCPSCPGFPECAVDDPLPGPDVAERPIGASLRLIFIDGNAPVDLNASDDGVLPHTQISWGDPHLHGDINDGPAEGEPCFIPPGFPNISTAGQEAHLSIEALDLTGTGGVQIALGNEAGLGTPPAIGEAQGTCLDFPASAFLNLYLSLNTGSQALHNETPLVARAQLPNFDWDYSFDYSTASTGLRRTVFVDDHRGPPTPVFDDAGVQRGYVMRSQVGIEGFPPASSTCEVASSLGQRASITISGATEGVLLPGVFSNHIKDDKDLGISRRRVTVYQAWGDPPAGASAGDWAHANQRVSSLVGSTSGLGSFIDGDAIVSLSFGRDGTAGGDVPVLYFSVGVDASGVSCSDVRRQRDSGTRTRVAADLYSAPVGGFGSYASALGPRCPAERGNCLMLDQTAIGLGPLTVDMPGQEDRGLADNVVALELEEFDDTWAFMTFEATDPPLEGTETVIYAYQATAGDFRFDNLVGYVDLGIGGLGILQSGDVIDALAVSDVTGASVSPDGTWNDGDALLFSLASGSVSLGGSLTPGHIFRVAFGDTGNLSSRIFATPASLGLLNADDVDALDVGASQSLTADCNANGIEDQCEIALGIATGQPGSLAACSCAHVPVSAPLMGDCCGEGNPPLGGSNRVLAFQAGEPGRQQAVRVTIVDLPPEHASLIGTSMWVTEPQVICENSGALFPDDGSCPDAPGASALSFQAASLACHSGASLSDLPFFMDWHGVCVCNDCIPSHPSFPACGTCVGGLIPGAECAEDTDCQVPVHVAHSIILPSGWAAAGGQADPGDFVTASYRIEVVDSLCDFLDEGSYSPALDLSMSKWGDIVENCATSPCGPPNGGVDIVADVTSVLDKFKNQSGAPLKSRAEVEPLTVDWIINISDVTIVLDAFQATDVAIPFVTPVPCASD